MKALIITIFTIIYVNINAQQSSIFSQAADQFGEHNPAGLSFEEMKYKGYILNVFFRNQWWNEQISGHPQTQGISWLNTTDDYNNFGIEILVDKIGVTNQFGLKGKYFRTLFDGFNTGIGIKIHTHRINIGQLDIYDDGDQSINEYNDTRLKLSINFGIFYFKQKPNKALNWFGGLSFEKSLFIDNINKDEEDFFYFSDIYIQGGIRWRSYWFSSNLRYNFYQPPAADFYIRKYILNERFFVGAIFTSDLNYNTAGAQFGYEHLLNSGGIKEGKSNNHYLTFNLGFSKPLSDYNYANTIIFDGRIVWSWERVNRKIGKSIF